MIHIAELSYLYCCTIHGVKHGHNVICTVIHCHNVICTMILGPTDISVISIMIPRLTIIIFKPFFSALNYFLYYLIDVFLQINCI